MTEKMVILKNTGDAPLQVSFSHNVVCAHRQVCTCQTVDGPGTAPIRLEHSVRVPIKQSSEPLPAAVQLLPHVKALVAKGRLTIAAAPAKVEKIR